MTWVKPSYVSVTFRPHVNGVISFRFHQSLEFVIFMNDHNSMKQHSETCKSVRYLRAKLIVYDLGEISLSRHRTLKFNSPPNPITHSSDSITGTFYSHSLPEKSFSFKHADVAGSCCQFQTLSMLASNVICVSGATWGQIFALKQWLCAALFDVIHTVHTFPIHRATNRCT